MFAVVGKGSLIEGFEKNLHLLFEQFAIGILVDNWGAEGFYFPTVVAATDADPDPTASNSIRSVREVEPTPPRML